MSHYFKNYLRPPLEWISVVIVISAIVVLRHTAPQFGITLFYINIISTVLIAQILLRLWQGYHVYAYQRNIKCLSFYSMSSDELPISDKGLFLGRGFKWQALHTQYLRDLKQARYEKYLKPSHYYLMARKLVEHFERLQKLSWLTRLINSQYHFNPFKVLPDVGGNPAIHGVEIKEHDVYQPLADRVGHTMILGTTRVGKTRLLELMISQDIRRNDSAVIVIDPKGDIDLLRRVCHEAKVAGRENDVLIFHLGYPADSARYNPIGNFARITEVANRVANQLPSSGESAAFREFAWRFVNVIAKAQVALGQTPNYKDLDKYILNIDPLLKRYCESWLANIEPTWQEKLKQELSQIDEKKLPFHLKARDRNTIALVNYVDSLQRDDDIYDGLRSIFNYDQTYFQKITASLSPLFAKLTTGKIAELISPDYSDIDDERPIFDWLQVIRGKKIVYIGLDALSDATVSSAVGNSMFADLCSTIGQIYKFGVEDNITDQQAAKKVNKVNVYSDEFNELAGDEFIPLANKGGGAGLQLTVATQTASDVIARLGSHAKANQVFGNFNTLICLRVLEESTARILIDKLPQRVVVKDVVQSSSTQDAAVLTEDKHFTSHTEDRIVTSEVPLVCNDDLMQLPKGQAFALLHGGQLWKLRFPLPKADMKFVPENMADIVRYLQHS